jgi:hypothetical protein
MTVKDLSFWGLFKLSVMLDFLIPIFLIPIFLIVALFAPEKIIMNWPQKFDVFGVTLDATSGDINVSFTLITGLVIGFVGLIIQCAILYFLAQKTPLGRIRIGR